MNVVRSLVTGVVSEGMSGQGMVGGKREAELW